MTNEGVKKFIENRTIEDIMEDYSEQRAEWETLFERKNGYVTRFRHSSGKHFFCLQYDGECGTVLSEFEQTVQNKTVEEQMENFHVESAETTMKLSEYEGVEKLLLKGDVLIGVVIKSGTEDDILLAGKSLFDEKGNTIYLTAKETIR